MMAVLAEPGIPNARRGAIAPLPEELFAASEAMIPSGFPLPKESLSLDQRLASL